MVQKVTFHDHNTMYCSCSDGICIYHITSNCGWSRINAWSPFSGQCKTQCNKIKRTV